MEIDENVDLYVKIGKRYLNTGHKVGNWDELQMRQECEQWADELNYWISYHKIELK